MNGILNENVLKTTTNAYGLRLSQLAHVSGVVNNVYRYPAQNGHPSRIVRLTNQNWRNEKELFAELHFMNYLFENGVSVPEILPSKAGKWIENVSGGYHASMFTEAPGRIPTEEDWNQKMFRNWGSIVGQMHLLTQSYIPPQYVKRREWKQENWMDMMKHLPFEETIVRQKASELLIWLETLPKDKKNYGLIHCDLHAHNMFFTKDGKITAFDFYDSCYHWFAFDIAIIIYSVIVRYNRQTQKSDTLENHLAWFLESFLKGYEEINTIDPRWLKAMPKFLKYIRVLYYNVFHQRHNWKVLDDEQKLRWLRMKAEIETDEPLTNYSF
jgi:amicoumacin kinase